MPGKCNGSIGKWPCNTKKDDDRHEQIGGQHVKGVRLPIHRKALGPSPDQDIEGVVDRVEDRIQPGLAIHDDVGEIAADRDAEQKNCQQHRPNLHQVCTATSRPQNRSGWITA
jgi:hypothetical protein